MRQRCHQWLAQKRARGQSLLCEGSEHESDIDALLGKIAQLHIGGSLAQVEPNLRVLGAKLRQHARQHVVVRNGDEAHRQRADLATSGAPCSGRGLLYTRENLARFV